MHGFNLFNSKFVLRFTPILILSIAASLMLWGQPALAIAPTPAYDWLQFNGDPQHTGNNTFEKGLDTNNVRRLRQIYITTLTDVVDGAPVYLNNVKTEQGIKNLLFMTSKTGGLFAVDAQTGALIWSRRHYAGECFVNKGDPAKIPEKLACWTTSIPAIDPSKVYVYSYGLDGYVHKHTVTDGTEIKDGGWPELVTRKPWVEKVSPGLTIATAKNGTNYLYVATSGYPSPEPGDWGDYQGHLITINLQTGTRNVFNAMCSNILELLVEKPESPSCPEVKAGIWSRGGVSYFPPTDRIFLATGNGTFDPANNYWSDSVLAFNPDGTGVNGLPVDSYTPGNFIEMKEKDLDLAAYTPLFLPAPAGSKYPHLILQGGKDRLLRLLNADDLSGTHKAGQTGGELAASATIPFDAQITTSPAMWINPADKKVWIFTPTYFGVAAWTLGLDSNHNPQLTMAWKNKYPCTSPLIANGVMYCAAFRNIWAFNVLTGERLWGVFPIGDIHWQSPIVVNGVLYITDDSAHLIAYAAR